MSEHRLDGRGPCRHRHRRRPDAGLTYNPVSQIATNTRSNDSYAWSAHYDLTRSYTANGLNQYTATGSVNPTYDGRGNLTSAGNTTYGYSSENMLTSASGGIALAYDPMLRLQQTSGGGAGTTKFGYDGKALIAEYNSANTLLRRYVHGPGSDEPVVWYEGTGTGDRRWLHADERGSVIAVTDSAGATIATNAYDEFGIPKSGNVGRFQYTGQTWLPELGMYHYKARIYSPTLGRFLQTDPIGYGDGMNMYAYVGGDPVNFVDRSGLGKMCWRVDDSGGDMEQGYIVASHKECGNFDDGGGGGGPRPYFDGGGGGGGGGGSAPQPAQPEPEKKEDICKSPAVQEALKHPDYKNMLRDAQRMSQAKGNIETGFNFGTNLRGQRGFGDVYRGYKHSIIFRETGLTHCLRTEFGTLMCIFILILPDTPRKRLSRMPITHVTQMLSLWQFHP